MDKNNKDNTIIIKELRRQIENFQFGLRNTKTIKKGIILFGNTRVGKSTIFLTSTGDKIVSLTTKQFPGFLYDSRLEQNANIIGHGSFSKTRTPNIKQIDNNIYIIDCPGLMDTGGVKEVISNNYFIMKIFEMVKQIRFIICVQQGEICSENRLKLQLAIQGYFKYFKGSINIMNIINCTSMIVNKSQPEFSIQQAEKYLQNAWKFFQTKETTKLHSELLKSLLKNKAIHCFQIAKKLNQEPSQKERNIIVDESKKSFYKLDFKKDITFVLDVHNDKSDNMKGIKNFVDEMIAELDKVLKINAELVMRSLKEIIGNIQKKEGQKSYKYRESFYQFLKLHDIYNQKFQIEAKKKFISFEDKKIQSYQADFGEYFLMKKVQQIMKERESQKLTFNIVINKFLEEISSNIQIRKQNSRNLYCTAYVLSRIVAQKNILAKIVPKCVNSDREVNDTINNGLHFDFNHLTIRFIESYEIKGMENQEMPIDQYLEFIQSFFTNIQIKKENPFFQPLKKVQKKQVKRENKKNDPLSRENSVGNLHELMQRNKEEDWNVQIKRNQLVAEAQSIQGQRKEKNNNYSQAYLKFQQSRETLQRTHKNRNSPHYKQFNRALYKKLGSICQKLQKLQLATEYYKVIRFNDKVQKLYELIRSKSKGNEQIIHILLKQANFYKINCYLSEARQKLDEAFEYCETQEERKRIISIISETIQQTRTYREQYDEKIKNGNIYTHPNEAQIVRLKKSWFYPRSRAMIFENDE